MFSNLINCYLIEQISNFIKHILTYFKFIGKNFIAFLQRLLKIIYISDIIDSVKQFPILNVLILKIKNDLLLYQKIMKLSRVTLDIYKNHLSKFHDS